jgi:uncharacterized protein
LFVSLGIGKDFPEATGFVNDFAEVLSPESEAQMTAICTELREKTGAEIAVATFKNLDGDEIDGFSVKLFEQWMPGKKGIDNGILLVLALEERKVRIEIGYGLEPVITDAEAGEIRRDVMTPHLARGDYSQGFLLGVATIAQKIADEEHVTLNSLAGQAVPRVRPGRGKQSPYLPIVLIAFILLVVWMNRRRGGGGGMGPFGGMGRTYGQGPFIGGGFGGGFGGGGGGGFGGGFGGGGSGGGGSSGGF